MTTRSILFRNTSGTCHAPERPWSWIYDITYDVYTNFNYLHNNRYKNILRLLCMLHLFSIFLQELNKRVIEK